MKRVLAAVLAVCLLAASAALAVGSPSVTTGKASGVSNSGAQLNGTINPNGEPSTFAFQYGTTNRYGAQTATVQANTGSSPQPVSTKVSGLQPGTTYHFRIVGSNPSGTSAGADSTFTTTGFRPAPAGNVKAPAATTGQPFASSPHDAALRGTVNPNGAATTFYFEFGTTAVYGTQTTPRAIPAGKSPVGVTGNLSGLQAGRTYHVRLVARNAAGFGLGQDTTFTTPAAPVRRVSPTVSARTTPKVARAPYAFVTRGSIGVPAGVPRGQACSGSVTVRVKAGSNTVSARRVSVTPACTYSSRVRLGAKRVAGRSMRFAVRFQGNAVLKPRSARTQPVRPG